MNKKGFTVVELIVSFSLTAVITIFLVQIVMALNNIYNSSRIKTELLTKQSLISSQINKKFSEKKISSLTSCGNYCLKFNYNDNTSDTFKIDYANNILEFGNYATDLPEDSYFKDVKVDIVYGATIQNNINNAILNIVIPIYNDELKDENFGVNIAYQFNTDNSNIEYVDFAGKGQYIVLKGDTEQTFNTQTAFVEEGYTVYNSAGSVITGNVEVDNPLTTLPYKAGNYKIKYSLKDNKGNIISQATRSVTVKPSTYDITNLVTNGSFEDEINGWMMSSTISNTDEMAKYGSNSLKNQNANQYSGAYPPYVNAHANHKYYISTWLYVTKYSCYNGFAWSYDDNVYWQGSISENPSTNQWNRISKVATAPNKEDVSIRLVIVDSNDAGNVAECYGDGIVLIDLTEAFGAGNEPTKEWCDEHIEWFDGTIKINY